MKFNFVFFILLYFAPAVKAQTFLNGSFETWGQPNICEVNHTPDSWINYSTGCLALDEANQTLCFSTIPGTASNGNIYARACAGPDWQGGEGIYQLVGNLNPGQQYTFSFDYAGSNLYGGSDQVKWRVYIDDTLVAQTPYLPSSQQNWSTFTHSFTATLTTHKIGFRAYFIYPCTSCDGSTGIDNIKFNEIPTSVGNHEPTPFALYPIPMKEELSIQNNRGDEVEVALYDVNGKEVIHDQLTRFIQLPTVGLVNGIYLCVIRKNGNVMFRQTIIK